MNLDWTQIIIALIVGGASGVGLWQAFIVRTRLDSKERLAIQEQWQEINETLREERAALQIERISDRQLWQVEINKLEVELGKTKAELALTISAYQEIRSSLHAAESKIKQLQDSDAEKDTKIERLRRKIVRLGGEPDTGPLDQGVA